MCRLAIHLFIISLSYVAHGAKIQRPRLHLTDVCNEFIKCNEDLNTLKESCSLQGVSKVEEEFIGFCKIEFTADFGKFENIRRDNRNSTETCIKHSVKTATKQRLQREKVKFCSEFIKNQPLSAKRNCPVDVMKMENRCQALRQCCDPAGRCEQSTEHSEMGRREKAMKEELEIKMADCKQSRRMKLGLSKTDEVDQSYCPRYLKCQKNLLALRSRCSLKMEVPKGGNEYSWNLVYNELQQSLDVSDFECKVRFSKQYEDVLRRRKQAQDYLDNCVPVANVTREFYEKQLPCQPDALMDQLPSETPSEDCLMDVFVQHKQCILLRNCCVQADVCERNAMYGELADEYLLAVTELKTDMDNCYHQLRRMKV